MPNAAPAAVMGPGVGGDVFDLHGGQLAFEPSLAPGADPDLVAMTPDLVALDGLYAVDPWLWMCEQVLTIDEAVQQVRPWTPSAEVEDMVTVLQHERQVAFPKTRRMRATWVVALHVLHGVRYKPHRLDLWMSRVEEGAAAVVDGRMATVEEHLVDPRLRRSFDRWRTNKGLVGRMRFRQTGSAVWAMATGADVFRSFTVSRVVIDESEFQDHAQAVLTAALPLVEKGAQIVVLSSSGGPHGVLAGICRSVGFVRFQ